MKLFALITAILFTLNVFSQDSFEDKIRKIINDTTGGFPNIRGDMTVKGELRSKDSYYYSWTSLILIDNTSNNYINYMEGGKVLSLYSYNSSLGDSVNLENGKKLCDQWKEKISSLAGDKFTVKSFETNFTMLRYGWNIRSGNLNILIHLSALNKRSEKFFASLSFDYTIYNDN